MSEPDKITLAFPVPPTFSVLEYVNEVLGTPYVNTMDFRFDELVEDLPKILKAHTNNRVAKVMLSHVYGEQLSKHFREWVRAQLDPSLEYSDGGASCTDYDLVP